MTELVYPSSSTYPSSTLYPAGAGDGAELVYFTVAEARERQWEPLDNETNYPDELIESTRAGVEEDIEELCGAFLPRTCTERRRVVDGYAVLSWPRVRAVTALSIDGTAIDAEQLPHLDITGSGLLLLGYGRSVEITYEHGRDEPPEAIRRGAIALTRHRLVPQSTDGRVSYVSTGEAGTAYRFTMPGPNAPFGIPDLDAAVMRHLRGGLT